MRSLALLLLAATLTGCATPILRAASDGRSDEVAALLAQGAPIEDKALNGCGAYPPNAFHAGNETPLICAAINGRLDTVKLLLAKGADVNARDFVGNTALSYATMGITANSAIAAVLRAKLEGRPLETAVEPKPVPAPAPVARKNWWEQ